MIKRLAEKPVIAESQIQLLARLCNAGAIPGYEGEVRAIVLEQVRPLVDELRVDALGNVLAVRYGEGESRLRVMIAAHMDEVGLMLVKDEGEGIYSFEVLGGLAAQYLAGKTVFIGRERIPGVIGTRPVHFSRPSFKNGKQSFSNISIEELRVDIGPQDTSRVDIGEWAIFATRFAQLGPSLRAKALDNRLGVASLIELLRHAPPNIDLLAAFTVQEEIGLRGAQVAAYSLDPDLALVLDCTPANDLPAWPSGSADASESGGAENTRYNTQLDRGPAIYIADGATISDPRLVRHLIETAEAEGLPYQFRQPGGGGTDAGAIHKQRLGIPSVSLSTPGRYLHTPAGITRREDWQNSLALAHAALRRITPALLSGER